MPDLTQDYFQRDLSDAEWAQLGRQLQAEGGSADRFLEGAERYYLEIGLKPPQPPRGTGGLGAGLALGLTLGLVAGLGLGAWLWRAAAVPSVAEATPTVSAAPTPAPTAVPTPARRAPAAAAAPPPMPDRVPPEHVSSPGFPGLEAVVELQGSGLVTARVLDPSGQERRLLKAGLLEAGRWRFGWDGRDEAGRGVEPGAYVIEVQEGERVLRKTVVVGVSGAPR